MKKFLMMLSAIFSISVLASCGLNKNNSNTEPSSPLSSVPKTISLAHQQKQRLKIQATRQPKFHNQLLKIRRKRDQICIKK